MLEMNSMRKTKADLDGEPSAKRLKNDKQRSEKENEEEMDILDSTQRCIDSLEAKSLPSHITAPRSSRIQVAECGVISKICLMNFMCHKRLEVELNANVNFIHGRNGSGKSAIMTGIVVGLGGKASATSRATSLKNFIRTGESFAEITIFLRNGGPDAYHPELYGATIEVVRRLNHDGTGAYKLKSSSGRIISNKKEELINIMEQFNIQVDNPVSLLNQDTSRNFLHNTDAKAKYKLFMKATLLDQIAQEYEKANETQATYNRMIDTKEKEISQEKKGIKELEEQWKSLQKLREMEGKVDELKRELTWSCVRKIEKDIELKRKEIAQERAKCPKKEQKLQEFESGKSGIEEQKNDLERELSGVMNSLRGLESQKQTIADEKKAKDKAIVEKMRECKKTVKKRSEMEDEKKAIQRKIMEVTEKQMEKERLDTAKALRQKKQQALHAARADYDDLTPVIASHQETKSQLEYSLDENRRKKNRAKSSLVELDKKIRDHQQTIQRLREAKGDKLKAFGREMPQVIDEIQRARHMFRKRPLGPIGSYLSLKDQKDAYPIECALTQSLLTAFLCDNHRDREILCRIFRQVFGNGRKPEIITVPFHTAPYRDRPLPACRFPTVMSQLKISEVNISNYLMEKSAHQILLIKDAGEARLFMHDRSKCPAGYRSAYTSDGSQVTLDGFYSGSGGRSIFLQSSTEESVRSMEAEIASLTDNKRILVSEVDQSEAQERQDNSELRRIKNLLQEQKTSERALRRKIDELEAELAVPDEDDDDGVDVSTLEGEIHILDEEIANISETIRVVQDEVRLGKQEGQQVQEKLDDVKSKMDDLCNNAEVLSERIERKLSDLSKYDQKCNQYKQAIATIKENVAVLEQNLEEHGRLRDIAEKDAVGERIETDRSPEAIDRQIKQVNALLARERDGLENLEEVRKKLQERITWYKETVAMIDNSRTFLRNMKSGMARRFKMFGIVQEFITFRSKSLFKNNLERRGYYGNLEFNHEEEKLEMTVQVDTAAKSGTKNQKTLSGGERSFSTVCFIMSLWDAIEAPFRVLDEFDVFMDMVNRKMSMKLLLKCAEENSARQFIFLTPQNMSDLVPMNQSRLTVMMLEPPVREGSCSD